MSYGVQFPTGGGSNPYPPSASYRSPSPQPQQQVQIQPGSITYTTSQLPDGRIQYNQFRAETRSYQTPQGPVHGIQWIPVNVTYELPSNAQPAGPDFHASWSRPSGDKDTQKMLKEWQRDQEKRARDEEKRSAKRMKEWEKDRRDREKAEEKELRRAQERDMLRDQTRGRKLSNAGYGAELSQYSVPTSGYARTRSRSRVRRDSAGQDELARAMAEMAMEKDWVPSQGTRERRGSNVGRPRKVSINERPRRLSTSDFDRRGTPYPTGRPAEAYPYDPYDASRAAYSDRASPYMGGRGLPHAAGGGPVYPPGHIYAGKPIPGMQGDSLGSMQGPYGRTPSPRPGVLQLESPSSFTRPPSLAVPYTFFDPLLIIADMNELYQTRPVMPAVLGPHDVWVEDWVRCLEDLARAWTGKLPMRERNRVLKNHTMAAQLIDLWNASFFSLRGVELVLRRGRYRRSGPYAGRYDARLGADLSSDEESDTISSVSDDETDEDRYAFYGTHVHHGNPWLAESREARRMRKVEKKVLEKQKRKRREREKERGSGFSLILTCVEEGQPRFPSNAGGHPRY